MILCDTNIIIQALNFHQPTLNALDRIDRRNISLPSIVAMELFRGMSNKDELRRMRSKIAYYDLVHLTTVMSAQAVYLIEQFKLSHNLQIPDALIGATAIVSGIPLFTYNTKDFAFMPGINLYRP